MRQKCRLRTTEFPVCACVAPGIRWHWSDNMMILIFISSANWFLFMSFVAWFEAEEKCCIDKNHFSSSISPQWLKRFDLSFVVTSRVSTRYRSYKIAILRKPVKNHTEAHTRDKICKVEHKTHQKYISHNNSWQFSNVNDAKLTYTQIIMHNVLEISKFWKDI